MISTRDDSVLTLGWWPIFGVVVEDGKKQA